MSGELFGATLEKQRLVPASILLLASSITGYVRFEHHAGLASI